MAAADRTPNVQKFIQNPLLNPAKVRVRLQPPYAISNTLLAIHRRCFSNIPTTYDNGTVITPFVPQCV